MVQELKQLPTALNAQKVQAIELLARGVGPKAVAEELGIARSTLTDWRNSPEFVQALAHHMRELEKVILDPTPRLQGIVAMKEAWPELARGLVDIARNGKTEMAKIAALKMIKEQIDKEELELGPTEDEKIIEEWAKGQGIVINGNAE